VSLDLPPFCGLNLLDTTDFYGVVQLIPLSRKENIFPAFGHLDVHPGLQMEPPTS